jgi:hypothetical protein
MMEDRREGHRRMRAEVNGAAHIAAEVAHDPETENGESEANRQIVATATVADIAAVVGTGIETGVEVGVGRGSGAGVGVETGSGAGGRGVGAVGGRTGARI